MEVFFVAKKEFFNFISGDKDILEKKTIGISL